MATSTSSPSPGEAGADHFKTITQPEAFRNAIMTRKMGETLAASGGQGAAPSSYRTGRDDDHVIRRCCRDARQPGRPARSRGDHAGRIRHQEGGDPGADVARDRQGRTEDGHRNHPIRMRPGGASRLPFDRGAERRRVDEVLERSEGMTASTAEAREAAVPAPGGHPAHRSRRACRPMSSPARRSPRSRSPR